MQNNIIEPPLEIEHDATSPPYQSSSMSCEDGALSPSF